MSGSGEGFGREVYPAALADAVRPRRLQLRARPVPPQPFVPQIVEVSLDYTACADILLDAPDTADPGARVTQVPPFGSQELFPARTRRDVGLLQDRLADGILMLNLPAAAMEGPVSLLFDLAEGSHDRLAFVPEPVAWHRLTARGWRRLPNWAVTADSTDGLMRSGIVSLDLPGDAVEGATELPGSGIWIAATANRRLDDFPGLAALRTNGLRISVAPAEGTGHPGPRTWAFEPAVPGLGAVTEVVPVRGGTRAETTDAFNTRVAERLRHRQRAVTPWDVERLVLTAFPEVWKAKCFPALDRTDPAPAPGRITVVVVPFAPQDARDAPERRVMFDVLTLRRIRSYLAGRLSPFAEVEVRNPGFERIQLHARFRFARNRDDGALIRRIKGDVSRMLSVWTAKPPMNGFGWSINLNDIRASLIARPDVEAVHALSALHLTCSDEAFHSLDDSAPGRRVPERPRIAGREPWSLPLPLADHSFGLVGEAERPMATRTGISGLSIGETLVVTGANR